MISEQGVQTLREICAQAIRFLSDRQSLLLPLAARMLPPPPCPFEPARSPSTSTMSTRAQMLVSYLHHLKSSLNARLPPLSCPLEPKRPHLHHVHSSSNARHLPPPCLFERKCLSPTSTGSNARHPLPPCLFKRKCSSPTSTVSIRAQTLVIHLNHFHSSAIAHFLFFTAIVSFSPFFGSFLKPNSYG